MSGKTQTIVPWEREKPNAKPAVWFHDIFNPDGSPYDPDEITTIRKLTGANE